MRRNDLMVAVSIAALVVASLVTVVLMVRAAGWIFRPSFFYLWALLPYLSLGCYMFLRTRDDPAGVYRRAGSWASLAVLGFTLLAYIDASFVHVSSTSGLAFLGVPLYLFFGGLLLAESLARLFKRRGLKAHG
jgi:hypothetical protein